MSIEMIKRLTALSFVAIVSSFLLEHQDSRNNDIEKPTFVLRDFCIDATSPLCGLNSISLNRFADFTAIRLIWLAVNDKTFAEALQLSAVQLQIAEQRLEDAELLGTVEIHKFRDETVCIPGFYDFLDDRQRSIVEVVGLRADGCVACTRDYFVKLLEIDASQLKTINKRIAEIRVGSVKPRFQGTFAAGGNAIRISDWEAIRQSVNFNFWVLNQLSGVQQKKLGDLLRVDKSLDELVGQYMWAMYSASAP